MATIPQIRKKISLIDPKRLEELVFEIIKQHEKTLVSLNKQQLSDGRDTNERLLGTYSRATEIDALYRSQGIREGIPPRKPKIEGEPYNFEDTGDFFDHFFLKVNNREAVFGSTGEATDELLRKFPDIFGLDQYNLTNVIHNTLKPRLIEQVRKQLT